MAFLKKILVLLRLSHWTKGIFVLLGVIYARIPELLPEALAAALSFCLTSSAVYIYNDLKDLSEDRAHPKKQLRPLASQKVSVIMAAGVLCVLLLLSFGIAIFISKKLLAILGLYLFINLLYNHGFRNIPVLDVLCITSGFMLRILAGTIGIGLPITIWLTLTATLLSLFIALNKRRLELNMGAKYSRRAVLKKYDPKILNILIYATAVACFISYVFYTVYAREELFYFLLTLPFAAFGLWRFSGLTMMPSIYDDPIIVFFHDFFSYVNLFIFIVLTFLALMQ